MIGKGGRKRGGGGLVLGESSRGVNIKEEEKEKSQNHEGDLYLLHCILLFNFLFQYYE